LLSPVIEELASDYPEVGFGKVNYDEEQAIALRFGVMNLPTILNIQEG
jgi:thioredoxin 1